LEQHGAHVKTAAALRKHSIDAECVIGPEGDPRAASGTVISESDPAPCEPSVNFRPGPVSTSYAPIGRTRESPRGKTRGASGEQANQSETAGGA
jgi:hypothetical protein